MKANPMSTETPRDPRPDRTPARGRRWVIAAAIALVALPLLWTEGPAEIARWYRASAAEAELDGDYSTAIARMDRAIAWSDREPNLYVYRASLRLENKDLDGALEDCNRALSIVPADRSSYALYQRALVYQRRLEHEQALQDIEQLVQFAEQGNPPYIVSGDQVFGLDYPAALNLRAYARALAERDIEPALEDIQQAIDRSGGEANSAFLDTRGYLRYLANDLKGAAEDTERAVQMSEQALSNFESQTPVGDPRLWQRQLQQLKHELAVLLHHRGLVHQALDHEQQAAEDLRRAEQYGYSPADGVW